MNVRASLNRCFSNRSHARLVTLVWLPERARSLSPISRERMVTPQRGSSQGMVLAAYRPTRVGCAASLRGGCPARQGPPDQSSGPRHRRTPGHVAGRYRARRCSRPRRRRRSLPEPRKRACSRCARQQSTVLVSSCRPGRPELGSDGLTPTPSQCSLRRHRRFRRSERVVGGVRVPCKRRHRGGGVRKYLVVCSGVADVARHTPELSLAGVHPRLPQPLCRNGRWGHCGSDSGPT